MHNVTVVCPMQDHSDVSLHPFPVYWTNPAMNDIYIVNKNEDIQISKLGWHYYDFTD